MVEILSLPVHWTVHSNYNGDSCVTQDPCFQSDLQSYILYPGVTAGDICAEIQNCFASASLILFGHRVVLVAGPGLLASGSALSRTPLFDLRSGWRRIIYLLHASELDRGVLSPAGISKIAARPGCASNASHSRGFALSLSWIAAAVTMATRRRQDTVAFPQLASGDNATDTELIDGSFAVTLHDAAVDVECLLKSIFDS
ncbi:hypothetical protein B0H17DRAFT_1215346 [Mycena rosella]|uniref:Uncharacterized protein n=1 Tax=Mycena rosella TaxID=1033263 RepID=A0AAD7FXY3_MYCRO|nr:hypothetical protein B0H17DRAFT_1215346 [Mycena rosella]